MRQIREEAQPLIPQYSIRWLLGLTTVCAVVFAIFGMAVRGHAWAICISVGLGTLVLMAMIHALFYGGMLILASLGRGRRGTSPFATVPAGVEPAPSAGAGDGENPILAEVVS
ncbi:MAG: hypothetical protein GX621_06860 [Pirellulaceae bacterium]|nr:hypothetical protein [Pirellulaceae bacterium]